nr:MAG TPA: hypothetical protein [Caudoviricetes sp.]
MYWASCIYTFDIFYFIYCSSIIKCHINKSCIICLWMVSISIHSSVSLIRH